eukprot:318496_1
MSSEQQKMHLEQFLSAEGIPGNESHKLEILIGTIENIENEYTHRQNERINDLQLVLNNVYRSKGMLSHIHDYNRQLSITMKEIQKSINEIDKQCEELSTDNIVIEKRYKNFRNNVVGQADEAQWEMEKLFKLLSDDNYSDNDEEYEDVKQNDDHFLSIEHTDIGSLGLQLNKTKKSINSRNKALDEIATIFKQIRYGHAMQYHHNKDEYVWYRKSIDLAGDEERLFTKQFLIQNRNRRSNSITSSIASDDIGMLLAMDDDKI